MIYKNLDFSSSSCPKYHKRSKMNNREEILKNYIRWYKNYDEQREKEIFRKKIRNFKPTRAYIELTTKCNFNCIMCPRRYANIDNYDMSFEDFKTVLKNLSPTIKIINFTGLGEASLNKAFGRILKFAKEQGYFIEHTSNASCFDISNLKYIDSIMFSLDGLHKVNEIRKNIILEKIIETIKESVKFKKKKNLKTKIQINMVLSYRNVDEVFDMFHFCEKAGVNHLNLSLLENTPSLYGTDFFTFLEEEIRKSLKVINYKKIVDYYIKHNFSFSLRITYPRKKLKGMCVFIFRDFQINAKGELILCCRTQVNPIVLGNLKNQTLDEILETSKIIKIYKEAHLKDLYFEPCEFCTVGYPVNSSQ